jgi:CubicO group peptidase (beta-lactamase class C family)
MAGVVGSDGASCVALRDGGSEGAPPVDEDTRFVVGSLSKPVTALAVLRLVEQGRVALDDPVRSVIPELRTADELADVIRIEHLLTHSSGLPAEVRAEDTFDASWELDELLAILSEFPLLFPPGARSQYSNVGYGVLGLVIERVAGTSFEAFMADHVFAPMGMSSASYRIDAHTCPGYQRGADGALVTVPPPSANEAPAGGLILSPRDLAQFLTHLVHAQEGAFISPDVRRLLLTPAPYRPLPGVRQQTGVPALGFFVERRFGMNLAYHTGSKPGHLAFCHVLPERPSAVFTLIAGPLAGVGALWRAHVERLHALAGREALEQHGAESDASYFGYASRPSADAAPHRPGAAELERCAGRYGVLGYYDIEFQVRGNELWTSYGQMAELVPIGPYEFVAARYLPNECVRFVMGADGSRAVGVYVSMSYHRRLEDPALLREHGALMAARFGARSEEA